MATRFLDSSALFRRYYRSEPQAQRVHLFGSSPAQHTIFIARLASVELASALNRRLREGALPVAERDRRWRLFNAHAREEYKVVEMDTRVYASAEHLLFAYPLRTLDALQLACALVVTSRIQRSRLEFWTADRQQAAAATAEGLTVELLV
jgi:predicted nucleic acid-binding protein